MQLRGTQIVVDTVAAKLPLVSGTAVISGSGTSVALNDLQSGSVVRLDRNTGMTFVLPSPAVPGTRYNFVVGTNLTANSYIITGTAATSSYALTGGVMSVNDLNIASGTLFASTSGNYLLNQKVSLNGTTTGGRIGTSIVVTALSANTWHVTGLAIGSGNMLTPFLA